MERHGRGNHVALKDVQINPTEEECALNMEQTRRDAAVRGVQTKLRREECARDM
jgi:hypothetical protein